MPFKKVMPENTSIEHIIIMELTSNLYNFPFINSLPKLFLTYEIFSIIRKILLHICLKVVTYGPTALF